jgi:hypothetical protein
MGRDKASEGSKVKVVAMDWSKINPGGGQRASV